MVFITELTACQLTSELVEERRGGGVAAAALVSGMLLSAASLEWKSRKIRPEKRIQDPTWEECAHILRHTDCKRVRNQTQNLSRNQHHVFNHEWGLSEALSLHQDDLTLVRPSVVWKHHNSEVTHLQLRTVSHKHTPVSHRRTGEKSPPSETADELQCEKKSHTDTQPEQQRQEMLQMFIRIWAANQNADWWKHNNHQPDCSGVYTKLLPQRLWVCRDSCVSAVDRVVFLQRQLCVYKDISGTVKIVICLQRQLCVCRTEL